MMIQFLRFQLITLFLLCSLNSSFGQYQLEYSSAEILHDLQKLQYTTRVLYIAAHPDDENTRLISYLANGRKFETAYLSLTRGDGGQNVIGPELGEALGLIRTQELLAARRVDGGRQFFTRAKDFGYSKNPSETFNKWDKEQVLSDAVWVIRNFQPDIIITRFNETPGTTHGHHTASAMIAREAFHKAADPEFASEQLMYVKPWQTKKLYWNTSSWFFSGNKEFSKEDFITLNVGAYDAVLGSSYTEIAAKSRSKHKSQAFGSTGTRGEEIEYFEQWEGKPEKSPLFEGISSSWQSYSAKGEEIDLRIKNILQQYSPAKPADAIPALFELRNLIAKLPVSAVQIDKINLIEQLILKCSGFYHLLHHDQLNASPGDSLFMNLELVNRSEAELKLEKITVPKAAFSASYDKLLKYNEVLKVDLPIKISETHEYSNSYWLDEEAANGMYHVDSQLKIGLPENPPVMTALFTLSFKGERLEVSSPLVHKRNDRIQGEVIQPFYIVPAVSISFSEEVTVFPATNQVKEISVKVKALSDNVSGSLQLELPDSWKVLNAPNMDFAGLSKNEAINFAVQLKSGKETGQFFLKAAVVLEAEKKIEQAVNEINYEHIPNQVIITESKAKLILSDIKTAGQKIGYIEGAGDAVDEALQAMGYDVTFIDIGNASLTDLQQYDAIVAGIRAYNTNKALQSNYKKLFDYMKQGGTYLVQYNTSYSLPDKDFWPYPLKISRDRITVEEADMQFVRPDHQVLNYPNKISKSDFDGWIQERGLYFPSDWDSKYQPILQGADPGEEITKGALLVAGYGKGKFVYTGLSFFRELPAGVAGAYRLFANLIAPKEKQ